MVSKMKKKIESSVGSAMFSGLHPPVDHQESRPANVFRYIYIYNIGLQTVEGRFSDSSAVLIKYFYHF